MADRRYVYTPIPFLDWKPEETADLTALFNIIGDEDLDTDVGLASKVEGIIAPERSHSVEKIKERIPKFPQLKAIASVAAGYDYYYPQLKAFGIPIANCPDVHTDATADHAMSLLLAAGCGLLAGLRATILSERPHFLRQGYRSSGISGATLGIVGLGRIGSAIARRARGFDMQVLYHSRRRKSEEEEQEGGIKNCDTLDDMLPNCDYIVAACSLNEQTHRMFSKPQFMMMKHSATFVNISRGKVVDTDALVEALRTGKIRQAALDVTDPEPLPPGHPLLGLDNVIITPHMAVTTIRGITGCLSTVAKNLKAAIVDGKKMPNVISEINSPKV